MSNEAITLDAKKRDLLGKQVVQLRNQGLTPGVIHDRGKDSLHISISEKDLKKAYAQVGKHQPVTVKIDGKSYTTLIKEITLKPATSVIYHSVFQAIKANEVTKAEVPIKLVGEEIPAEKAGLLILQSLDTIEVEALPRDLVDVIEVNATSLAEAGDKLTVADIKVPAGITLLEEPEQTIATVEVPKDQIAEADAAAAEMAEQSATGDDTSQEDAESGEADKSDSEKSESDEK